MKPLTTANASVFATIALFILFNLPYVGVPALLICLLFFGSTHAGKVAKVVLVIYLLFALAIFVLGFIVGLTDYQFPLTQNDELEAFLSILHVA